MATASSRRAEGEREFAMRDADFRVIADAIYDHAGIVIGDHKKELVYSRLARRLRQLGLRDFTAYLARLDGPDGDGERNHLINALTTNHTNFFREPHHFDYIKDVLVPYWKTRAAKTGDKTLKIWSAGSSTGEEPYTLAMTLDAALKGDPGWKWKILATDIDTNVLKHCREGSYPASAISGVPKGYRSYCERDRRDGADRFVMSQALKSHMVFNRLNLHASWPIKTKFDAIFCRNVTIYFDGPSKQRLIERFATLLKPDACLFLGHSESLLGGKVDMSPVGRTIYAFRGGVHDA